MNSFLQRLTLLISDKSLRSRLLFVLGALAIFRVLAAIPIPGVNASQLELFFSNNQFFGLLNLFSGGGLSSLSIMMLGVAPYITASIIMQLLMMMVPMLKNLYQEEGELGRQKFSQYTRMLSLPIAVTQAISFLLILERQGVLTNLTPFQFGVNLLVVVAGSILLMWIGELISEFGLGNGVSLIIFAGIVAGLPQQISQAVFSFDTTQVPLYAAFLAATVAVVAAVVFISEAERPVPVTYAKRVRGMKFFGGGSTYLPLRLNQAGVIPIIFALSLLLIPQMFASFFATSSNAVLSAISASMLGAFQNLALYGALYFLFVFFFTYFYTAVTFDPKQISENLQKNGAFIPGVRPGGSTSEYLAKIITRITFVGALFLAIIAVLPIIMQSITGITTLALGGTALLIVVSVILDLARRIDAQISIREY
ncbi:MAG: preprotein translocase subunit SecY [Parcubacteria group bacterium Gr01-1014_56]|nr:MAG: preprotein translocase subunit SecY [Parcubacteria group bacterium Gr01-1014_56]